VVSKAKGPDPKIEELPQFNPGGAFRAVLDGQGCRNTLRKNKKAGLKNQTGLF
jgi:hypothetical protein